MITLLLADDQALVRGAMAALLGLEEDLEVVIGGPNPLTDREKEVLRHALDGLSAAVIAARVHLSPGTVRNHLSSAIGKTGTANRVEAARRAQDLGWL